MHSFFIDCQSLRELRITSLLIIAAIKKKEMWVGFKCNGPVNFLREEVFQIQHMCFPALPPLPPHQALLLSLSVGQSPHHGLQDDVYEAEGGSSYRGDTPISFVLEADLPEPVIQREVRTVGESDFCQHRNVVVLPESVV